MHIQDAKSKITKRSCCQSSALIYFPIPVNLLSQMPSIKMFYLIQGGLKQSFYSDGRDALSSI